MAVAAYVPGSLAMSIGAAAQASKGAVVNNAGESGDDDESDESDDDDNDDDEVGDEDGDDDGASGVSDEPDTTDTNNGVGALFKKTVHDGVVMDKTALPGRAAGGDAKRPREGDADGDADGDGNASGSNGESGDAASNGATENASKRRKQTPEERAEVNRRTVFVGNVAVETTAKMLKRHFAQYGAVESVRFRSVAFSSAGAFRKAAFIKKEFHQKRKCMNAYVVYTSDDGAAAALAANATVFNGRHLRVDLEDNARQRDNKNAVFVGNLSLTADEEDLWEAFAKCGDIVNVRLVRDNDTNVGRGFGFVVFSNEGAVALALKCDGLKVAGRDVRVKRDKPNAGRKLPREEIKRAQGAKANGRQGPAKGSKNQKNTSGLSPRKEATDKKSHVANKVANKAMMAAKMALAGQAKLPSFAGELGQDKQGAYRRIKTGKKPGVDKNKKKKKIQTVADRHRIQEKKTAKRKAAQSK